MQALYIYGACLWYLSPFIGELPTLAKAMPVFVGLLYGIFILQTPIALIEKNIFTTFAAIGFVYSLIVAVLLKSDWALFMQINMLFTGMLAYYVATPYLMQPYSILWIIGFIVLPSAVANNVIQGHSFTNIVGALAGTRSTFTTVGGTHHVMGFLGGLCLLAAWATWNDSSMRSGERKRLTTLCAASGAFLLLTSGARSFVVAAFIAIASTLIFAGRLRKLSYVAYALPVVIVVCLYGASLVAARIPTLGDSLQFLSDSLQIDATTGRSELWELHLDLWNDSPLIGNRLSDMVMTPVTDSSGVRAFVLRPDGTEGMASTEAFYDFFLARDGLTAVVTFAFFYCLYAVAVARRDIVFFSCMVFWCAATFGQPLLRITYSFDSFLMALAITQCYRRSMR